MQVLYCVLHMLKMDLYTRMPLLSTFTWLSLSMYATAEDIYTTVSESRQSSKCVQSPGVLQTCVVLVSLLSISLISVGILKIIRIRAEQHIIADC